MSEPKFTKGPWKSKLTRVYSGNKLLFSQDWWDSPYELDQAKANATLAAAAPELYRMLEKLLMAAKTSNEMNPVKIHNALIHDVEDALNKAGGGDK